MKRVKEEVLSDSEASSPPPATKAVKTEEFSPECSPVLKATSVKVKSEQEVVKDIEDSCDLAALSPDSVLIRLGKKYGFPHERDDVLKCKRMNGSSGRSAGSEALDVLVETILSQNTTDKNSHQAFMNLKGKWPTWRSVADANVEDLQAAIKIGGLSAQKSRNIQALLKKLIADGHFTPEKGSAEPSLDYMCGMSNEEIRETLNSFKGVGPKTAACTMLFGFCRDSFPVDTHVFRVVTRLGLVKGSAAKSRETAQDELESIATEGTKFDLHILMIGLGKRVCHSQKPQCGECPLAEICEFAKGKSKKAKSKKGKTKVKAEVKDEDDVADEGSSYEC